ncbi:hypothetical protein [Actinomadura harenae]|uniref:VWA domain-containing protein n=1 Tax=Actinomadura harenae TaxID=2483351 RepID=A0A3M2L6B7_9ACTN|nr:hypothetical protein [Actinomadura harenae]RMI33171.1 hypothetical protein EBO15_41580 [Actinomadura harenae]
MTNAHVISGPTPGPATKPRGAWLRLSAALSEEICDLADREDLTVTCAPGKGHGAPGCFIPELAAIELDGSHLGHHPDTCDPSRPADRTRYAPLWGVLVHEAAHAAHTRWTPTPGTSAAHVDAALVLEETRIEAAQLRRRPADRRWLRASASSLILADFTTPPRGGAAAGALVAQPLAAPPTVPASRPNVAMTPWNAARAAGLLLARTDLGILERAETAGLAATIASVLGTNRLVELAKLWRAAHVTPDEDRDTMLELGRRWCELVGTDPNQPAPTEGGTGTGNTNQEGSKGSTGAPSQLAEAIGGALAAVEKAEAAALGTTSADADAREQRAHERAARVARKVFNVPNQPGPQRGPTAVARTRAPHPAEQSAARRLARALRSAAHREPTVTAVTSPMPPGRLRMRDALAADAQRAAGAIPTAEPFTQTTRRPVPSPPLRIGIACDVTGSMQALADPVASAAWILARAAAHVPDAQSATVIFGTRVRPVTSPGVTPARVAEFTARDSQHRFAEAVDALDGIMDLSRTGAARLLIVVSDGIFPAAERALGRDRIARLTAAGCAVLWLAMDERTRPIDGADVVALTDPAQAAAVIGTAATRALRRA